MKECQLSILIPARCEEFLGRTIQDILENIEADTEVIATLDGEWANPPIPQHERVNIIYVPESIGQRAAGNIAARLARGRYLMKVDAHCGFDKGFDRKMLEGFKITGDNVTAVPIMRNLHAFDWVCTKPGCGWKKYQGPTPEKCEKCGRTHRLKRKMMWISKHNPQSWSYCFDSQPHFQYNEQFKHTTEGKIKAIIGYKLSFDLGIVPFGIVNLLTDLARSHQFACSGNSLRLWENMASNTVGFPPIDNSWCIGTGEIFGIRDQSEVERITASPVLTDVVNYGYISTSTPGEGSNKPSVGEPMCEGFLLEFSTPTVTPTINSPLPNPATRRVLHSNLIEKFNSILGGEFVYSEIRKSFHNGSVSIVPVHDKRFSETLSLQGSCFMASREKYWELELCGEDIGSWGNQGIEIACKTWLSGGRVLVNHTTYYGHMFRTQGGDFGFPYPQSGREVQKTKKKVWNMMVNGWPQKVRPLSWLIEKFAPVPGWTEQALADLKAKEKVYDSNIQ